MLKPSGGFFKKMFSPDNMAKKLKKPMGAVRSAGRAMGRGVGIGAKPNPSRPTVFTKQAPTSTGNRGNGSPRVGIPGRETRRPERVQY